MMHRLHAVKFISSSQEPQIVRICRRGTTQVILEMICAPAPNETRWRSDDAGMDIAADSIDDIIVTGHGTTRFYWDDEYPSWIWS